MLDCAQWQRDGVLTTRQLDLYANEIAKHLSGSSKEYAVKGWSQVSKAGLKCICCLREVNLDAYNGQADKFSATDSHREFCLFKTSTLPPLHSDASN